MMYKQLTSKKSSMPRGVVGKKEFYAGVNENRSNYATPSLQASRCIPEMRQKTPAVDENRSHYTPSVQASLRTLRIAMANQIRKTGPDFAKKIFNCKSVSKKINILFFDRTCFKNTSYQSSNTRVCNRQDWMRGLVKNALYNPSERPIFESQGGSPAESQVRNSKLEFGWPTMFRSGRMSLVR